MILFLIFGCLQLFKHSLYFLIIILSILLLEVIILVDLFDRSIVVRAIFLRQLVVEFDYKKRLLVIVRLIQFREDIEGGEWGAVGFVFMVYEGWILSGAWKIQQNFELIILIYFFFLSIIVHHFEIVNLVEYGSLCIIFVILSQFRNFIIALLNSIILL